MDDATVVAQATAQALVDNSDRLGLTWQLRPATVVTMSPLTVTVDGDTVAISAASMVGIIETGARVFVLLVPPGGAFVAGWIGPSAIRFETRQTLTSSQNIVTFSPLPTNLRELEVGWQARGDTAGAVIEVRIRLNNNSSGIYSTEITQGAGAATASALINNAAAFAFVGHMTGSTATSGIYGGGKIWFEGLDRSAAQFPSWTFNNSAMAAGGVQNVGGGFAAFNAPITRLDFIPASNNFIAGSTFYLKGTYS